MKKVSAILVMVSAMFYACEKSADINEPGDKSISDVVAFEEEASIENIDEAVDYEIEYFSGSNKSIKSIEENNTTLKSADGYPYGRRYRHNQCPDVTIESNNGDFPKTITLNYGDSTVLENGRVLSGVVVIELSAKPKTEGATRLVSFETFKVDSVAITGEISTLFNVANDSARSVNFSRDITYTFPDGFYVNKEGDKVKTWVSGLDTAFDNEDDVILITGSSKSETSDGRERSKVIIDDLVKNGGCRYIVQGTVEITKHDGRVGVLDYGNGDCDEFATLTIDGEVKEIEIRRKGRKTNN